MKPTLDIPKEMLSNDYMFKDQFYERFNLRHAEKPLTLNEEVTKNYFFPTFYSDVTCSIGIFMCSYEKALKLMIHPSMVPVKMPGGRTVVIFSNYIYRNVMGVRPYNEIAMTIPVRISPLWNVPALPLVLPIFKDFGYYVFSMPVTSLENQIRGTRIWGLPKIVSEIDIQIKDNECRTVASDLNGVNYLELNLPTSGGPTHFDVNGHLYSKLGIDYLKSQTSFKGTFNVKKNMSLLFKKNVTPDKSYIKIGKGEQADMLRSLEIEEMPFQTRFCQSMNACFDLAKTSSPDIRAL